MSSHRCEASARLLGQLTVCQDKFLIITQSHYCAISAANEECEIPSPPPPPFPPALIFLLSSPSFFPGLGLRWGEKAWGGTYMGGSFHQLHLTLSSQIHKTPVGLERGSERRYGERECAALDLSTDNILRGLSSDPPPKRSCLGSVQQDLCLSMEETAKAKAWWLCCGRMMLCLFLRTAAKLSEIYFVSF